jgi:glycosyltransferase involved in cell wall biosynthesis
MEALSVVIITYNEEKNIGRCLSSVAAVADEIIVVDSFSDDETVKIALAFGAIVKQSRFDGYVDQKNKAINMTSHDFVLLLDADEALSEELSNSIKKEKETFSFKSYTMNRCSFFCGKFIKHGLWYPDRKLRLFDKRFGKCGGMNPHDRMVMDSKFPRKQLKGDLLHYTYDTMEAYMIRNEAVSSIAARSLFEAGIKKPWAKIIFSPIWAFLNGYFLRMGFLEGYHGFIIAVHTANQSFAKYQKLRRMYKQEFKKIIWE